MAHDRRFYIRLIIIVAAVLAFIVVAWLLITGIAKYLFVGHVVDEVTSNLSSRSGLSVYLIRGIVIIVSIPFFVAVAIFAKRIPLFWTGGIWTPRLWLYTKASGLVIVFYIGLYSLAIFWASRTAISKKYCVETPEGLRAFDSPGPEPIYGLDTHPCAFDEIEAIRIVQGGTVGPARISITDARHYAFFSPTGKPVVWYYKSPSGEYEFFDKAGLYPGTGEPLRPIDNQARNEIIAEQKSGKLKQAKPPANNSRVTTLVNSAATKTTPPSPAPSYATPRPTYQPPKTVSTIHLQNVEITITACHYSGDRIRCSGTIVNMGSQRLDVLMHKTSSKMVDDLGNQNVGELEFAIGSGSYGATLEPELPMRLEVEGAGFPAQPTTVSLSITEADTNTSGVIRHISVQ